MPVRPKRFQLNQDAARIVVSGHPWIFRSHLSTAANVFKTGDRLRLYNGENTVVGIGAYDSEGLVAIRVLSKSSRLPDAALFREKFEKAFTKRVALRKYSNSFRALHGENDGVPGVVLDIYGSVGVLQTYSKSMDSIGRYAALWFGQKLQLKAVLWKTPHKVTAAKKGKESRWLRGSPQERVTVTEGKLSYQAPLLEGQKSGSFLDLRGLRKWIAAQKWEGAKVLNLFSYTGTLGLAAEKAGAKEIWNVDISPGALAFSKRYNAEDKKRYRWVEANIFEWVRTLPPNQKFDVLIVDPAQMTSRMAQVPVALKTYRKIYQTLLAHLNPNGYLIGCCCTSRISRKDFKRLLDSVTAPRLKGIAELGTEDDHPIGFDEGDYLKIFIYKAGRPK